eukprot:1212728-Amphidinium_carterae.2
MSKGRSTVAVEDLARRLGLVSLDFVSADNDWRCYCWAPLTMMTMMMTMIMTMMMMMMTMMRRMGNG